jgi:Flp pilus assembly protein TadG
MIRLPFLADRLRRALSLGTVSIEFALILPFLALLLAGLIDLGYASYESMEVQSAAEAGAQYASTNSWDTTAISNAVTSATEVSGITAMPAPSQFCACADGGVLTAVSCVSTCGGGLAPSTYALVSAQVQHWTVLHYPGLPYPLTLTAQSRRRLK